MTTREEATYQPAVTPGWLRRNRAAVALVLALLLVLSVLAVLTTGGKSGELDPDAFDPTGAHALSVLLQDRGVEVHRTTDLPSTRAVAEGGATVFVPFPSALSDEELTALDALPGELVVVDAKNAQLTLLGTGVRGHNSEDVTSREPGCASPAAQNAGSAELGGTVYGGSGVHCYGASVVLLAHQVLLGDASFLSNGQLASDGNAALAIGLLGQQETVAWLIPDPARAPLGVRPVTSPDDLLPDWVAAGTTQLFVALLLLALWRARRLGRVVTEPLPVVVRAAETVEGRGRLYRAAGARVAAAEQLRAGARRRLGPRVGAGRNPVPEELVAGVAAQTHRGADAINALLYGPQPADDTALVRLADDLDALTREVTGS